MCSSSAPDMSGANAAALAQAELSKEQLAWAKEIYAETAPDRAASTARANAVSDAQLTALTKQTALTDDYADYNKTTFRPLEQSIVADANSYDTVGKTNEAVGKAQADVNAGFSSAQAQQSRSLSRMGVNPSSGRALAMGNQTAIAQAASLAGASSAARDKIELQGYARKMDAANMGRGLASSQATSAGVALNQGNSAAANGMQSGAINAQGNQIMTQGYAGAQSGLAGASQTYLGMANVEQRAGDNSALMGALGTVAGAYIGKPSDKNIKNSRKKISGKASLDQIKNLPSNEQWRYNKGSLADDGGKTHQGHMAQDVQRVMGDKAAPGGKVINLEMMASAGLSAIKEVAKGQEKLDRRLVTLENARRK
jgi:hypothetical protein